MRIFATRLAAAALLLPLAAPAEAGGRHHRNDDDVAAHVIAAAAVIGGLAALASVIGEAGREKQDRAVERCATEAEGRIGGRVSEILFVGKRKGFYTVEGAVSRGTSFTCTVRRGAIYDFQFGGDEA
jgi:hypothetical protein